MADLLVERIEERPLVVRIASNTMIDESAIRTLGFWIGSIGFVLCRTSLTRTVRACCESGTPRATLAEGGHPDGVRWIFDRPRSAV